MKFSQKVLIGTLIGMVLISFVLSICNFNKFYGYEEGCFHLRCTDWATGNDWISENCRPKMANEVETLFCDIIINDKLYNLPLLQIKQKINIDELSSCKGNRMECASSIYVKIN